VDNLLESVVCCTATALGLPPDALLNTHRLDAGTSGVVVLAKTSSFAAWFNLLLKNKPHNVEKIYRCLTDKPPPLGSMVHYATMRVRAGGEPAHTRMRRPAAAAAAAVGGSAAVQEEGARCELVVLQVGCSAGCGTAAAGLLD
jgi:23S rRNA-/tRNA-specific pseudouridylate synthase